MLLSRGIANLGNHFYFIWKPWFSNCGEIFLKISIDVTNIFGHKII